MYYGSAEEHDMDFNQFCIMFQSIFLEGFWRPAAGIRHILTLLLNRYKSCNGELKTNNQVKTINTTNYHLQSITLQNGKTLTCKKLLSSAGYLETLKLCNETIPETQTHPAGKLAYLETIFILDKLPKHLGFSPSITFFNNSNQFSYQQPNQAVDFNSGVLCAPNNFLLPHKTMPEGQIRLTHLANYTHWNNLSPEQYQNTKQKIIQQQIQNLKIYMPTIHKHIIYTDMFTPTTIKRYTGHINGSIYGSPKKQKDGTTPYKNIYICGTDQGFLGIIGSMLSGVSIANLHLMK